MGHPISTTQKTWVVLSSWIFGAGSCAHEACVAGTDSQGCMNAGPAYELPALGKISPRVDRILPLVIIGE